MDKDTAPRSTDDLGSSGLANKEGHQGTQGEQESNQTAAQIRFKLNDTPENMAVDQLSSSDGEDCTSDLHLFSSHTAIDNSADLQWLLINVCCSGYARGGQ